MERLISEAYLYPSFTCSIGQQFAMKSFQAPGISPEKVHAVWHAWFSSYKFIVLLSAPMHLTTIASSLINMRYSALPAFWWACCILFVIGHAYPLEMGKRHFNETAERWGKRKPQEARAWVDEFVEANGTRLVLVDLPGWLTVVTVVIVNLGL